MSSAANRHILAACVRKPRQAKDISQHANLPLASTYRHIRSLVDDGLLIVERSAMTQDGKPYDLYRSRVKWARLEVRADDVRVEWENQVAVEDRLKNLFDQLGDAL